MALYPHGSRVYCNKKLPSEAALTGEETLEFIVDGQRYSIALLPGAYLTKHDQFYSDLPPMITEALSFKHIPLICKLGGIHDYENNRTVLVFEHTDTKQHHDIDVLGGSAYAQLIEGIYYFDEHEDGTFKKVTDIVAQALIVNPGSSEVRSTIAARLSAKSDLPNKVSVRNSESLSIKGSASVVNATHMVSALAIRKNEHSQLNSSLSARVPEQHDLGSFLSVTPQHPL
ncbi:hypothetical protein BXO87_02345 [Bacillus sp. GZB]|uniref:hypothetical protein n=1 Tax=Bacillus TaxID=1386 RepID=UPI000977EE24|nr:MULTISPECIES: hypothetical protein [Bacillus]MCZ4246962.1 hypothetical protein [Bacillus amyloliquefaciens]OMQ06866.1 hypothetical protein BXO87_02345 [Bacillus sp. GZB]